MQHHKHGRRQLLLPLLREGAQPAEEGEDGEVPVQVHLVLRRGMRYLHYRGVGRSVQLRLCICTVKAPWNQTPSRVQVRFFMDHSTSP